MELQSCMVCDAADIRENLLFVLGGGVQRFVTSAFPSAIPMCVAGMLELDGIDTLSPHDVVVEVVDSAGDPIGHVEARVQCGGLEVDQVASVSWVLPLAGIPVPEA